MGVNMFATARGQHCDHLSFAGPIVDPNPKQQSTGCDVLLKELGMVHADRVCGKSAKSATCQSYCAGSSNG